MPKQSNSWVKGFAVPSQEPPSWLLTPCPASPSFISWCWLFDMVTQPIHKCLAHGSPPASASTSTVLWLGLSSFPPTRKEYEITRQTSDTKTGLVKQTKQKPSLTLAYLIWFIKQACESEALVSSTHVHCCFLQRAKHSCPNMLTGSMPSSTIKCCQLWSLSHTGDSPNPAGTQLPAELWACCSPVPEGFCPGFLSSHLLPHTSPAAPPTASLHLWHTTNCSKLSFLQCIPSVRQWFNKVILCKTNVLKGSHDMEETARRQREEDAACGAAHMPRLWRSQSLTDLELWQWFIGGAGNWWARRAAMGYLIKLKLSWFSHRPPSVASISSHPYG